MAAELIGRGFGESFIPLHHADPDFVHAMFEAINGRVEEGNGREHGECLAEFVRMP